MSNWQQSGYDPSQHKWRKGEIDDLPGGGYAKNYFFADTLKMVDIAFGSFFKSMHIYRYTKEGENKKEIEIPIKIGPRGKAFDFRVEKETGDKIYIQLPNITYQRTGGQWASDRAAGQHEVRTFYSDYFDKNGIRSGLQEKFWRDIQPVPYDLTYELVARFEYASDAHQFTEQVLARFSPECYLNVREFWFVNMRRSLKMKLDSYSQEMSTDYQEEEKREITVTFSFTVEAYFYKPIEIGEIIDQVVTTLSTSQTNLDFAWRVGLSGNYDGSFSSRYNFGEIYGTKIGRVSAVKPESTLLVPNTETSSYYAKYEYEEFPDITNYPWGSVQPYAVSAIWDPKSAVYNKVMGADGYPNSAECINLVPEEDREKYTFRFVVEYNRGFGNVPFDILDENNKKVVVSAGKAEPRGGVIISAYKDLSGYGDFIPSDVFRAGTKDVDLGYKVVKDAPWISSATILREI